MSVPFRTKVFSLVAGFQYVILPICTQHGNNEKIVNLGWELYCDFPIELIGSKMWENWKECGETPEKLEDFLTKKLNERDAKRAAYAKSKICNGVETITSVE